MKKIDREAVRRVALSSILPKEENAAFLNRSVLFEHNLRLSPEKKETSSYLLARMDVGGYKQKQKELDLEILCANLLRYKRRRPVAISLNQNTWKKTKEGMASRFTIEAIHLLKESGYIGMKKGFHFRSSSKRTRIWPEKKLLELFKPWKEGDIYEDFTGLIELRDDNKLPITFKENAKTRRIRRVLNRANSVNRRAEIKCILGRSAISLNTDLHAIFIDASFEKYGRLHASGPYNYQQLSKDERKNIRFDHQPIVELDYSGLHPRLIYAKEGIQYDDDPYIIFEANKELRESKDLRDIVKTLLIILLNSDNEKEARKAGNYHLKYMDRHSYRLLKGNMISIKRLINRCKQKHKSISHYFCSGKDNGLRVMNLDAKMALDIVDHFTKKDIPILAIHDSFIVQKTYRDELYLVMSQVYEKYSGGFSCPIKHGA